MSRHNFFPKDDDCSNYNVVVGWDRGLSTFFFQYGDVCSDLPLTLATGQRYSEHHDPDIVVALATHFGDKIPEELAERLLADRESEGSLGEFEPPLNINFSTQADNGDEINTAVSRESLSNPTRVGDVAEWVIHQFDCDEEEDWDRTHGPTLGTA